MGPKADGGYLIPDDLEGIEACFSPGVSVLSGFEKDCANLGMKAFLADKSVDQPADEHELFNFKKIFIGATSNDDFITLDQWVSSSLDDASCDLLLQIDIEGCEYEVFLSATEALMQRFRIIVAEFHHLDQLWNKAFFNLAKPTFEKILQTHACVHIHPNNFGRAIRKGDLVIPEVMEFTFLRRDRIEHSKYQTTFPHPFDDNNFEGHPPMILPDCWHSEKE